MNKPLIKIVVFIPTTHLHQVRTAIGDGGYGSIGTYSRCSFVTTGKGYFTPGDTSNPTLGSSGQESEVLEVRLEFLCYEHEAQDVIDLIKRHHPYEKVAMDIIPILNHRYNI